MTTVPPSTSSVLGPTSSALCPDVQAPNPDMKARVESLTRIWLGLEDAVLTHTKDGSDWLTFQPCPVTVGHVQDPSRFFVQTEPLANYCRLISECLRAFPLEPLGQAPRFGQSVVLRTADGFFRAKKLHRPQRFYLIDTGQEVQGEMVMRMPDLPNLAQMPATIRCHVHDVQSVGPVDDLWAEEARERFQHWVKEAERRRERLLLQSRGVRKLMPDGGWSLPVELYFELVTSDDPMSNLRVVTISLSQRLLREKWAALAMTEGHLEVEAAEEEEEESLNSAPETGDLDENVMDEIDFYTVKKWLPPRIPSKTNLLVRPTHLDDLGQLNAQLYESRHIIREMRTQFKMLYEFDSLDPFSKAKWEIGEACAVRYSKDDDFYRGLITGRLTDSKEMYSVLFVDFGNVEVVSTEELRIPITFGDVPIQNIRFVFADIQISLAPTDLDAIHAKLCYENTYRVRAEIWPDQCHLPLQAHFFTWNGAQWEDVQAWCKSKHLAIDQRCDWEKNQAEWSQNAFGIEAVMGRPESANEVDSELDSDQDAPNNHQSPFSFQAIDFNQGLVRCVIVSIFSGLEISVVQEKDLKDYDKMVVELQAAADQSPPANPIPGLPVAAMSDDTKQFRRAYIVNEKAVWFVDWQEMMPLKRCVLKQLPDCFLDLPEFGHRLVLSYEHNPEIIQEDILIKALVKKMKNPSSQESLYFKSDNGSNVGRLKLKGMIGGDEVVQDFFESEIKRNAIF